MSVIDIVLGSLLVLGAIRGFMRGLFTELASFLALLLGVCGAWHFSYFVADFLNSRTDFSDKTLQILSFAITFLIIVVIIIWAGQALTKIANFILLGFLNKLLGSVFGLVKVWLILSIVLMILDKIEFEIPYLTPKELKKSTLYVPVKSLAPSIFPSFKDVDIEVISFEKEA